MPTLDEINTVAPDTPVFVLHLYDRALLNQAALRAVGYTKDTPEPPGGEIRRDHAGNPTGLLIARPNAMILYSTLAKGPKLAREGSVSKVEMTTPMALICKALFPSISTFETPPTRDLAPHRRAPPDG